MCNKRTEVFSRVCGFMRPIQIWNRGKKAEHKDRVNYDISKAKPILDSSLIDQSFSVDKK